MDYNVVWIEIRGIQTMVHTGGLERCKTRPSAALTCSPPLHPTSNQFQMSDFSASHSLCLDWLAEREWAHLQLLSANE